MNRAWRWLAGADRATRAGLPIDEVLAPMPLVALVLLVVNDWVLKPRYGGSIGWLTGKLSDVAGLALAPLVLTAATDVLLRVTRAAGAPVDPTLRRWKLALACAATGGVFVAVKLSPAAAGLVARGWDHAWSGAAIVADPTDLLTVPALALAWWQGRRAIGHVPYGRLAWIAGEAARGRPRPVPLADVRACGADPAALDALDAAVATWIAGGPPGPVDAAVARLRGA